MSEPDWFTSPLREVRREPLFLEQIAALGIDSRRLEEALAGLDYALSKRPEVFPQAPLTPFSRALLYIEGLPPLRVFFTYDAVQVKLICVEFTE
jgi:hypothetical protein